MCVHGIACTPAEDYTLALEKDKVQGTLPRRHRKPAREERPAQSSGEDRSRQNGHSSASFQARALLVAANALLGGLLWKLGPRRAAHVSQEASID